MPKVLEPCGICCQMTIIFIAVLQWAGIQSHFNQEVIICHCKSIAVCLSMEAPAAQKEGDLQGQGNQWKVGQTKALIHFRKHPLFSLDLAVDAKKGECLCIYPL